MLAGEARTTAVDLDTMIMFAKLVTKGALPSAQLFCQITALPFPCASVQPVLYWPSGPKGALLEGVDSDYEARSVRSCLTCTW